MECFFPLTPFLPVMFFLLCRSVWLCFLISSEAHALICICLCCNLYHAEFLKWNTSNTSYIFGTVHYFQGYQDENLKLIIQQVRLHGCAGWPDSILVAEATYFRCWQGRKQIQPVFCYKLANVEVMSSPLIFLCKNVNNKLFSCPSLSITITSFQGSWFMACIYDYKD